MLTPKVSIVIPLYNLEQVLAQTLQSIMAQDFQDWECILVDDGSSDTTSSIAKKYQKKDPRFRFFERPQNLPKGANSCRNFGFTKVTAPWVMWLDGDDLLKQDGILVKVPFLEEALDGIISKLQFVTHPDLEPIKENRITSSKLIEDYVTGKVSFYICGGLWKRSFLENQEVLFDPAIRNLDDWDFNLRLLYEKPSLKFIDQVTVSYRQRNDSLTGALDDLDIIEIQSEINTRKKHIALLQTSHPAISEILSDFLLERWHYFYKRAMMAKDVNKRLYFKEYIRLKKMKKGVHSTIITYIGFVIYAIFNRGYSLLR